MLQTWPLPNYFQHLSDRTRSCLGGTVGRRVRHERYPWCLQHEGETISPQRYSTVALIEFILRSLSSLWSCSTEKSIITANIQMSMLLKFCAPSFVSMNIMTRSWLKIHQDGTGHIASTCCLVEVHVDALLERFFATDTMHETLAGGMQKRIEKVSHRQLQCNTSKELNQGD